MKRLALILIIVLAAASLCACGGQTAAPRETAVISPTAEPEPTPAPATAAPLPLPETTEPPAPAEETASAELPETPEGWADGYIEFLDDNYDIFAALWPEGLSGVGFIDLDLDGMPEMVIFDLGASATLGAQLFDQVDGQVICVSSVREEAAGAFGSEDFSDVSVCASFYESFRLSLAEDGLCFWVDSANGTMESSWDEIVRFGNRDGVLTLESVCSRMLENNAETGLVTTESYTVAGRESDAAGYEAAASRYMDAPDLGYEAAGVFLWNDMTKYDTTYDGLLAMARDAAAAYVPISPN